MLGLKDMPEVNVALLAARYCHGRCGVCSSDAVCQIAVSFCSHPLSSQHHSHFNLLNRVHPVSINSKRLHEMM